MGTLTNSEDPDEMQHFIRVYTFAIIGVSLSTISWVLNILQKKFFSLFLLNNIKEFHV